MKKFLIAMVFTTTVFLQAADRTTPIVGNTKFTIPDTNSQITKGLLLTDVNGDSFGEGTLKGSLHIAYMNVLNGGTVVVDNSPPSGSASISDAAGNSFGVTAGKFYFGVLSGSNPLPVFGDNASAIAGGLEHGNLYRTGGDPDVICIVH